ncbi:hypothetical protein Tco_0622129 [Tanacetum coccineum]
METMCSWMIKVDDWEFKGLFDVLLVDSVEEQRWCYVDIEINENDFDPIDSLEEILGIGFGVRIRSSARSSRIDERVGGGGVDEVVVTMVVGWMWCGCGVDDDDDDIVWRCGGGGVDEVVVTMVVGWMWCGCGVDDDDDDSNRYTVVLIMMMVTSCVDGDEDGVMWMTASVALAGGGRRLVAAPD